METFKFELFGGYKVTVDKKEVVIEYLGEKLLFFFKSKPRTTTIPLDDVIRIDMKEAGSFAFGYVRFVTKAGDEFVSSSYMARHDAYSFMVDKDENERLNKVLALVKQKYKHIPVEKNKN